MVVALDVDETDVITGDDDDDDDDDTNVEEDDDDGPNLCRTINGFRVSQSSLATASNAEATDDEDEAALAKSTSFFADANNVLQQLSN